jgi:hypothetical protein
MKIIQRMIAAFFIAGLSQTGAAEAFQPLPSTLVDNVQSCYRDHFKERPYRLVIYEKGGHSLREHDKEVRKEIVNWFRKYLGSL